MFVNLSWRVFATFTRLSPEVPLLTEVVSVPFLFRSIFLRLFSFFREREREREQTVITSHRVYSEWSFCHDLAMDTECEDVSIFEIHRPVSPLLLRSRSFRLCTELSRIIVTRRKSIVERSTPMIPKIPKWNGNWAKSNNFSFPFLKPGSNRVEIRFRLFFFFFDFQKRRKGEINFENLRRGELKTRVKCIKWDYNVETALS